MGSILKVEMDSLAKAYWNKTSTLISTFYPQSTFGWSIWIGARKLSTWNRQALYNHAQSTDILDHWSKQRAIPKQFIHSIDWEAGKDAIKALGLNWLLWIPKWIAGFSPVGKVQQHNNFQDHAECP
jgi:hypothetical protein